MVPSGESTSFWEQGRPCDTPEEDINVKKCPVRSVPRLCNAVVVSPSGVPLDAAKGSGSGATAFSP